MSETLLVRPAQESDLPALLDLYTHLHSDDVRCPPDEAAAILRRFHLYPGSVILLGMLGNACIASCALAVIPNLTRGGAPYALIENVVTRTEYRNRGFGKAMLKAATEQAWREGCYKTMLMTGSKRASTIAFYKSAGFEPTKTGFQIRRP